MEERKKRVLNAIINDYIATAEPVGSRAITKRYDLGVSPATIRNEMSDLTEEGYIEQPHTSAGRAPTAKGYRFYVDNLMERSLLTPVQLTQIRQVMTGEVNELDEFMRSCCNLISSLTNYTAIAAVPERGRGKVENLQLVMINERQALIILITSSGLVRHKIVELSRAITPRQLVEIEQELKTVLIGREMQHISNESLSELIHSMQLWDDLARQARDFLEQSLGMDSTHRIYTGGVKNMLSQPEFHDIEKLKNVFSLLEADDKVQQLLRSTAAQDSQLTVTIGQEMPLEGAQDCSMVVANYFVNGEKAGSIGVLGPTRMSYGKTVSLMEQIASELGRAISEREK